MFAQCTKGEHDACQKVLNSPRVCICDCPCHGGRPIPANPCGRCHGTGFHGPVSVEGGRCFDCGGTGDASSTKDPR